MQSPHVLIIDNDRDLRGSLADLLELEGFQVHEASTETEARVILRRREFDLAIIDVRLRDDDDPNDLSGLCLCTELDDAIARIVLTGYPPYQDAAASTCSTETIFKQDDEFPIISKGESPTSMLRIIIDSLEKGDNDAPHKNTSHGQ